MESDGEHVEPSSDESSEHGADQGNPEPLAEIGEIRDYEMPGFLGLLLFFAFVYRLLLTFSLPKTSA